MGDFGVFPAPGQADFLQQRHLRRWAENFQKVWYEKIFWKFFRKTSNSSFDLCATPPLTRARVRWHNAHKTKIIVLYKNKAVDDFKSLG